jgi:hypothetical protein
VELYIVLGFSCFFLVIIVYWGEELCWEGNELKVSGS